MYLPRIVKAQLHVDFFWDTVLYLEYWWSLAERKNNNNVENHTQALKVSAWNSDRSFPPIFLWLEKITWPLLCSVGLGYPPAGLGHHQWWGEGSLEDEKLIYRHLLLNAHTLLYYDVVLSSTHVNICFHWPKYIVHLLKLTTTNQKTFYKKNVTCIHYAYILWTIFQTTPKFQTCFLI